MKTNWEEEKSNKCKDCGKRTHIGDVSFCPCDCHTKGTKWNEKHICTKCYMPNPIKIEASESPKDKVKRLSHHRSVKLTHTIAGQREMIREITNKLNEVIDFINNL